MKTWGASALSLKKKRKWEKNELRLESNDFGFICAGVSNMGGYKRNAWYNLSYLLTQREPVWPSGKALGS